MVIRIILRFFIEKRRNQKLKSQGEGQQVLLDWFDHNFRQR
jgi:hypothetical protein